MELMLFFWLCAVVVNILIAQKKGLSIALWVVCGLLFGFFSTLILLLVPASTEGTVRCGACAETIKSEAKVCKHCGTARAA